MRCRPAFLPFFELKLTAGILLKIRTLFGAGHTDMYAKRFDGMREGKRQPVTQFRRLLPAKRLLITNAYGSNRSWIDRIDPGPERIAVYFLQDARIDPPPLGAFKHLRGLFLFYRHRLTQ